MHVTTFVVLRHLYVTSPFTPALQLPTRVDDSDAWSRPSTLGGEVSQPQLHPFPASFVANVDHDEPQRIEAALGSVLSGVAGDVGAGAVACVSVYLASGGLYSTLCSFLISSSRCTARNQRSAEFDAAQVL